jgi:pimeloyl-ACP methyl ester carboxylesterase
MPAFLAIIFLLAVVSQLLAAPLETAVEAPGPKGPLRGAMLTPDGVGSPVVVIIPGSGPTDRDGNSPLGIKASTYKLLAQGLAEKGIVTVRIDKRGLFGSAGAIPDPNAVTIDDYAVDIHNWATALRKETGARCVWLLGHSEGGLIALVASRSADDICGLILAATPGRSLGDVLREQLKANPANAPILDQAMPAIDALAAGHHVDVSTMHPGLMPLFRREVQDFLISEIALDPAELIKIWHKPALVLQGERDLQIGVADAERLKHAAPNAKLVPLPDTNHVLKTVASPARAANLATYADPSLPLAPGVVDQIASFIHGSADIR